MPISAKIRRQLIEPYGGRCPVCGRRDVPLEVCHIVPFASGGTNDVGNLAGKGSVL